MNNNHHPASNGKSDVFRKFATTVSRTAGSARTFIFAILVIITWACVGPLLHFTNTWQLMINTTTTVVTFLMVFLIQNTQNRDSKAVHLKLDELIRAIKGARNNVLDSENLSDEDLESMQEEYAKLHQKYELELKKRRQKRRAAKP